MKISFYTLGCKVNQYETEAIRERFSQNGWEIGDFSEACDAYLINTCTVTSLSDRKSRQMIRRAIRQNPKAVVAVCGCYAQMSPAEVEGIEGVTIVVGTKDKLKAYDLVCEAVSANTVGDLSSVNYEDMEITTFESKTRAIVKAQDGCNNFCSYCIIPYARGRVRSRSLESLYEECQRIAQAGYQEIVLAGIHICSYGTDLSNVSLVTLLETIHPIPGINRIHLSSIEPNAFTDEFIAALKSLPKVCPHFHISLQSGCEETLKRMNRRYTAKEYKSICEKLFTAFPEAAVTTDLIVGFPGETQEEFYESYSFVESIPFYQIHTFPYSPRKGTKAAAMENQVDAEEKTRRSKKVLALSEKKEAEFLLGYVGKTLQILPETWQEGLLTGHSPNYLPVSFPGEKELVNQLVMVKIIEHKNHQLLGELV